jgi:CheY-like chemotaxis protein
MVGHAVRVARDGRAALEAAESFRPHVVLLDLSLPVMDGHEVARRIRQTSEVPMKVIAITGWRSAADRDKTTATGFDHHLLKPVNFFTLQSTLRSIASEVYAS